MGRRGVEAGGTAGPAELQLLLSEPTKQGGFVAAGKRKEAVGAHTLRPAPSISPRGWTTGGQGSWGKARCLLYEAPRMKLLV